MEASFNFICDQAFWIFPQAEGFLRGLTTGTHLLGLESIDFVSLKCEAHFSDPSQNRLLLLFSNHFLILCIDCGGNSTSSSRICGQRL